MSESTATRRPARPWLWRNRLPVGIVIGVVPLLMGASLVTAFWLFVATVALAWVVIGNGVNVIVGTSGTPALHSAATMAISAYSLAILLDHDLGYWVAFPCAVVIATVAATLLLLPAVRLEGFYLAIASFIAVLLVQEVINQWDAVTRGPLGMSVGGPSFGALAGASALYPVAVICAATVTIASWWLTGSTLGVRLRAARDSRAAARTAGISPVMMRIAALVLGNAMVALGGCLLASATRFVDPTQYGLQMVLSTVLIVWVGGLDRIGSPLIGALLISVLPNLSSGLQQYATAISYGLLLVVLLLRPQGLITLLPGVEKRTVLK